MTTKLADESLTNFLDNRIIEFVFEKSGIHYSHKYRDIKEQIIFTLMQTALDSDRVHEQLLDEFKLKVLDLHVNVAQLVIISHIIDDVFDNFENHLEYRVSIDSLFKNEYLNYSSIFDSIIALPPLRTIRHSVDELIKRMSLDKIDIFKLSILRMIVAGLAQTVFKLGKLENYNEDRLKNYQKELINIFQYYTKLIIGNEKSPLLKLIGFEQVISKASALQEMFLVFEEGSLNWELIEAWNGILGPMVFLNNFHDEKIKHEIVFFDEEKNRFDSYSRLIKDSWNIIKNIGVKTDLLYEKKLEQFIMAYLTMKNRNKEHAIHNLDFEVPDISNRLDEIFNEILSTSPAKVDIVSTKLKIISNKL